MSMLVLTPSAPSLSQARTSEDQAALILYQSGREKFKADDFEGAAKDLSKANRLAPNVFIQFYLAIALQRSGNCAESKALLESLTGKLEDDQEQQRLRSQTTCLIQEAEAFTKAGDCVQSARVLASMNWHLDDALDLRRAELVGTCEVESATRLMKSGQYRSALERMEALQLPLMPANSDRRTAILRDCRVAIIGFTPDSPETKAAFLLVQEGLSLLDAGRGQEGIAKLERALQVVDEPHIHLHLARARARAFNCEAAAQDASLAAAALPEDRKELQDILDWCSTFDIPASAGLDEATRTQLMTRYEEAGSAADPITALSATLQIYDNMRVRLLLAHQLAAKERWKELQDMLQPLHDAEGDVSPWVVATWDLARFAVLDQNPSPQKQAIFERYMKAREAIEAGRWLDARTFLEPIAKNPFVALAAVKVASGERQCDEIESRIPYIVEHLPDQKVRLSRILDDCEGTVAAQRKAEKERLDREESVRAARARQDRRTQGYALIGVGTAVLGGAGVLFWRYFDGKGPYDRSVNIYRNSKDANAVQAARKTIPERSRMLNVYSGLGYAAAGVGAAFLGWGIADAILGQDSRAPKGVSTRVLPAIGTGGMGIAISGIF